MLQKLLGGRWATGSGDPLEKAFGILEREVMDVLWVSGELPVRDVQARLSRPAAYTTIMTTLDRLYKKGVLLRRPCGRAFLYSAELTRVQLQAQIAGNVLAGLLAGRDGATVPVLSNLVESVGAQDGGEDLLQALEELVKEKRRQLKKASPR